MENSTNHQIKVGIFIGITVIVLMTSIILLSGDRGFFQSHYNLIAQFPAAQGLSKGSMVSLAGIQVGYISDIALAKDSNALEVTLSIQSQYKNRITKGSQADLRTQGALGDKYIYIEPGSPQAEPLAENSILKVDDSGDMFSLISRNTDNVEKFFMTLDEIHKFMLSINHENRVGKILSNLEDVSEELSKTASESNRLLARFNSDIPLDKIKDSTENLNTILSKINEGTGTLGALINDDTIHNQLKSFLGEPVEKKAINSLLRSTIEKSK